MAYCLADSLINNPKMQLIDTYDLMLRFQLWWKRDYNAGTNIKAFGLGGNIKEAFTNFKLYL